jgi:hypothetical protein
MMKKKDPDPDLDPYKNMTDPGGPKNIRIIRIWIHHYNSVLMGTLLTPQKDTLDSYLYPLGGAHLIFNHLGSPVYLGMHICG